MSDDLTSPHPNAESILDEMVDVPNRFYRYPVAQGLSKLVVRTPLTPNQITFIHACVGLLSGYFIARGSYRDLLIAIVLAEARMILDCLDGVVARAKKLHSPNGRLMDAIGDAVGFIGSQVGVYVHLQRFAPHEPRHWLVPITFLMPALMALVYDLYKRKFASALKEGKDAVSRDLAKKLVVVRDGSAGFMGWFGLGFDWLEVAMFLPDSRRRAEKISRANDACDVSADERFELEAIRRAAGSQEMTRTLRILSWVSGDVAISLFTPLLFLGSVALAEKIMLGYGALSIVLGAMVGRRFLKQIQKMGVEELA